MRYVLGVDAAWTNSEPSGVALLKVDNHNIIETVKLARSYEEFYKGNIDWNTFISGSKPDYSMLLKYSYSQGWDIDLVALDIPLSPEVINRRRSADQLISTNYGGRGASTHSPNKDRPGEISVDIFQQLTEALFIWNGDVSKSKSFIEVYPHTSIIELFKYDYRLKYKVQKRNKFWPEDTPAQRRLNIIANLNELRSKLISFIPNVADMLHPLVKDKFYSIKYLKSYEDVLDALVAALTGCFYVAGNVKGYGDNSSTIWVPQLRSVY